MWVFSPKIPKFHTPNKIELWYLGIFSISLFYKKKESRYLRKLNIKLKFEKLYFDFFVVVCRWHDDREDSKFKTIVTL